MEAWKRIYRDRRARNAPGWTGDESYAHKQDRIKTALNGRPDLATGRFLELGCGAGNIALWMAEQGYQAYGIDIVAEAVQWANARMECSSFKADFRLGDIAAMPFFPDGFFDLIFDGDCFHMIIGPHRARSLAEVWRVLRPGGLFLFGTQTVGERQSDQRIEMSPHHYFDPVTRSIFVQGRREYQLGTERGLIEEIVAAGFEVTRIDRRPPIGRQRFVEAWLEIHAVRAMR